MYGCMLQMALLHRVCEDARGYMQGSYPFAPLAHSLSLLSSLPHMSEDHMYAQSLLLEPRQSEA